MSCKTLLLAKKGDISAALDLLKCLLKDTQKEEIVRLYTDLGNPMRKLLKKLTDSGHWSPHLIRVVSSFEKKDVFVRLKNQKNQHKELTRKFETLSDKEHQILNLISEGFRNKEIAHQLHYSVGTIKTYVYNIYQKIGANNRTKAIQLFKEFDENKTPLFDLRIPTR